MVQAMIFDLDGTLGDTLPLCLAAFRKAVEPLAVRRVSDAEILETFGPSEEATIKALLPEDMFEKGLHDYWHWYKELHSMCPEPFPGIREVLEKLQKHGIFLGLATGKAKTSADISLDQFNLHRYFVDSEYGWPKGPRKPEALQALIERNNLKAKDIQYVGDVPSDVAAARKAGVIALSAAWAKTAEPGRLEAMQPDRLFHTVAEFSLYVDTLLREKK